MPSFTYKGASIESTNFDQLAELAKDPEYIGVVKEMEFTSTRVTGWIIFTFVTVDGRRGILAYKSPTPDAISNEGGL